MYRQRTNRRVREVVEESTGVEANVYRNIRQISTLREGADGGGDATITILFISAYILHIKSYIILYMQPNFLFGLVNCEINSQPVASSIKLETVCNMQWNSNTNDKTQSITKIFH